MAAGAGDPLGLVLCWHEAVNRGDAAAASGLAVDDVEVAGPRGSVYGRDALADWVGRAGITLVPRRAYARGREVVVAADAAWTRGAGEGAEPQGFQPGRSGEPTGLATAFLVVEGGIARIARHPDVPAALADAGLSAGDAVDLPG